MHDEFPRGSLTIVGLNALRAEGISSAGPYAAKLLSWSDEETTVGTFDCLVDAINWLTRAVEDGALAKRLHVYSTKNELVWTEPGALSGQLRSNAMKQNAYRILIQTVVEQENTTEIPTGDHPLAPE
jgi:hypothetical protein